VAVCCKTMISMREALVNKELCFSLIRFTP